ncbi:MAG TPA: glycoside hydrolase family 2 TIM barrel-domain containing protein, partial [Chitinophagaceae bacterium]
MKQLIRIIAIVAGFALYHCDPSSAGTGTGRIIFSINDNWKFLPRGMAYANEPGADDTKWQLVSLPHTWNAQDPFDDDKTYKRGIGWYRKELNLDKQFRDKEVYLYFEGANQVADVYVNGAFAGEHKGGYTAFAIDITPYLKWDNGNNKNLVAVQVNNAHNPFIPPLSIGYALYGGIYRDAWLIATDKLHFSDINNNAAGVYITTPSVSGNQATVAVKTTVINKSDKARIFQFVNNIYDGSGNEITSITKKMTISPGQEANLEASGAAIEKPRLWSPDDPYLYQVKSQLIENGVIIDEVSNPLGFRWFSFDPDQGFSLNGRKLILRGTTRHQDLQGAGDALTNEDHYRDMKMIKEMGANFVRLAHYPQAPEVLKAADKLGLIIWEEVPVVNYMTISPEFLSNSENMIREMIRQGYNHPSVMLWGSMNEILLYSPEGARIQRHTTDTSYIKSLRRYAISLDSTIRREDPSRYTAIAMHLSSDYAAFKLDRIPQVAGYNIYEGWYSGKVEDFGKYLDRLHKREPQQIIFISEYGAEGDQKVNSENPVRMDYTGEYQRYFHEAYLRQINQRSYLAGTAIWNEFDFSQPNIGGTTPHRNQKGMVTWNRKPKDVYYLYKANWNPAPMVYIATRDWMVRAGEPGAPSTIDVYSNLNEVTLYVNGIPQNAKKTDDIKKCSWKVYLKEGKNIISASGKRNGKTYRDEVAMDYRTYNHNLSDPRAPFESLAVNAGSNAQYLDHSGNVWIADRPYSKGSFGYLNGDPKTFDRTEVIKNTGDVPLFYSFLDGIKGYRLDVPDGTYQIELCFAENERL